MASLNVHGGSGQPGGAKSGCLVTRRGLQGDRTWNSSLGVDCVRPEQGHWTVLEECLWLVCGSQCWGSRRRGGALSCPKGGGTWAGHLGQRARGTGLPKVLAAASGPGGLFPELHLLQRAHDAHTGFRARAPGSPPGDKAHCALSLGTPLTTPLTRRDPPSSPIPTPGAPSNPRSSPGHERPPDTCGWCLPRSELLLAWLLLELSSAPRTPWLPKPWLQPRGPQPSPHHPAGAARPGNRQRSSWPQVWAR